MDTVPTTATVALSTTVAAESSKLNITYTLVNILPKDVDMYVIAHGTDAFDFSSISSSGISYHAPGNLQVSKVHDNLLHVARSNGIDMSANDTFDLLLSEVKNRGYSGNIGRLTLMIFDTDGSAIEATKTTADLTITPNSLDRVWTTVVNPAAGATGTVNVDLVTTNSIPSDGKVRIIFPSEFPNLGGTVSCGFIGPAPPNFGTWDTAVKVGKTVTCPRNDDGNPFFGVLVVKLTNVANPGAAGVTGTFTVQTLTATDKIIDQDNAVPPTMISSGQLPCQLALSTPFTNQVADWSATCTTNTAIPADGKIVVRLDPSFDLSGTIALANSDLDGTFTVTTNGPAGIVTMTRNNDGSVYNPAANTLLFNITGIKNPSKEKKSRTIGIFTTTSADVPVDSGVIPPLEVYKGSMTAASVTSSQMIANDYTRLTIKFTLAHPPPVGGVVAVKLKDYSLTGAYIEEFLSPTDPYMTADLTIAGNTLEFKNVVPALSVGTAYTVVIEGVMTPPFGGDHEVNVVTQYFNPLGEKLVLDAEPQPITLTTLPTVMDYPEFYPTNMEKGQTTDWTFESFMYSQWENTGKLVVEFPTEFGADGALGVTGCIPVAGSTLDGTGTFAHSVQGRKVTCTRQGNGPTLDFDFAAVVIQGVKNPATAGFTGTFSAKLTKANEAVEIAVAPQLDRVLIRTDDITDPAGDIITQVNDDTGKPSNVTISFGVNTDVPATDSAVAVQFPDGYDLRGVHPSDVFVSNLDGNLDISINSTTRTITIERTGGGTTYTSADADLEILVVDAVNSYYVADEPTYCLWTFDHPNILDARCVTGPVLKEGDITFKFDWVDPEGDSTVPLLVEFNAQNRIPARCKIILRMHADMDVTTAKLGGINGLDGTFLMKVDGDDLVITRNGDGTITEPNVKIIIDLWNVGTPAPAPGDQGRTFYLDITTIFNKPIATSAPEAGPEFIKSPANKIHGPPYGQVKSSSMRVKTMDLGDVTFEYAEIQVEFTEDIYLNGKTLSSYKGLDPATRVPVLSAAAKGSSALWCKWGSGQRAFEVLIDTWPDLSSGEANVRKTQKPPIDKLIPTTPLGEPVFGILPAFGGTIPKGEVENNNRYNLFLLMSETEAFGTTKRWFSESDLSDCMLVIPGEREGTVYDTEAKVTAPGTGDNPNKLTTADGRPINVMVKFTGMTERDCEYEKFLDLNTKVEDAIERMRNAKQGVQAKNARVLLAALLSSDTAVDCKNFVNQYIGAAGTRTVSVDGIVGCFETVGTQAWNEDPCCNKKLQISQCCGPKTVDVEYTAVSSINEEKLIVDCQHPEDIVSLLADYNGFKQEIDHPVWGCTATRRTSAPDSMWDSLKSFFSTCEQEVFGSDRTGKTCKTNADCLTGKCRNKKCPVPWDNPEKFLVTCFVKKMDPLLQRFLRDKWGLAPDATEAEFHATLKEKVSTEECIGPGSDNFRAKIDLEFSSTGEWVEKFVPADNSKCEEAKECNWDTSQMTAETCTHPAWGTHFCQVCYSEQDCFAVDAADQATCEAGVCEDPWVPLADCGSYGYCDSGCFNATLGYMEDCDTEAKCQAQGYCNDDELLNYASLTDPYSNCLIPAAFDKFGTPISCFDLAVENGASYYSESQLGCIDEDNNADEATCLAAGGGRQWITKANNKTACDAYPKRCWDEQLFAFNDRSEADCLACGQTMKSIYSWTSGSWSTSSVLPGTWTKREFKPINRLQSTVNMRELEKVIDNAISSLLGAFYTTEALCKNKLRALEERIVCDCSTGSASRTTCTQGYVAPDVGGGTFFKEFSQEMKLGGASIKTNQAASTGNSGFTASLKQYTAAQYAKQGDGYVEDVGNSTRRFRMLRRPSLNKNDFSVVQDSVGNIIGQLIGDGADLSLTGTGALDVCLQPRGDIAADPKYTLPRFAGVNSDGSVGSVLDLSVTQSADRSICSQITSSGTYFPVMILSSSSSSSGGTSGGSTTNVTVATYTVTVTIKQTLAEFNEAVFLAVIAARLGIPLDSVSVLSKQEVTIATNSSTPARNRIIRRRARILSNEESGFKHSDAEIVPALHLLATASGTTNITALQVQIQFTDSTVMTAAKAGETFIALASNPEDSLAISLGVIPASAGGGVTGAVGSPTVVPSPDTAPPDGGVIRDVPWDLVGSASTLSSMWTATIVCTMLSLVCALVM
eukprot:TRINITY_DN2290_c0_g1_i4.p1 TRINITY_DN2290_c0_g1~~TRINITY_DN2290_c0_g1_i4.p1  ORF type:complete len:2167 (-),score=656.48 TRINITY_DN2290_c0_g1_i4:231-6731(-)